jgi:hypothetical protein
VADMVEVAKHADRVLDAAITAETAAYVVVVLEADGAGIGVACRGVPAERVPELMRTAADYCDAAGGMKEWTP